MDVSRKRGRAGADGSRDRPAMPSTSAKTPRTESAPRPFRTSARSGSRGGAVDSGGVGAAGSGGTKLWMGRGAGTREEAAAWGRPVRWNTRGGGSGEEKRREEKRGEERPRRGVGRA